MLLVLSLADFMDIVISVKRVSRPLSCSNNMIDSMKMPMLRFLPEEGAVAHRCTLLLCRLLTVTEWRRGWRQG